MYFSEEAFATEAEAHTYAADRLESIVDRVAAVARQEREKAASVAAKAQVMYV